MAFMGEPLPAFAYLPPIWAEQAVLRELPSEPGLAPSHAYWIENLGAWVTDDEEDAEYLREVLGTSAKILTPSELPNADPHFGTDEEMLAWCEEEGIRGAPAKDGNQLAIFVRLAAHLRSLRISNAPGSAISTRM